MSDIAGRPSMFFTAQTVLVNSAHIEHVFVDRIVAIGSRMAPDGLFGHFGQTDAFDGGGGASEIAFDETAGQANRVKDLRPAI